MRGHLIKEGFGEGNSPGKSVLGSGNCLSSEIQKLEHVCYKKSKGADVAAAVREKRRGQWVRKDTVPDHAVSCSPCKDLNFCLA